MSPDNWSFHYREAVRGLRNARREARAKRRERIERDKQFMDGMKRIAFIATDCASDSDAPHALDSIRGVAYDLINRYDDEVKS